MISYRNVVLMLPFFTVMTASFPQVSPSASDQAKLLDTLRASAMGYTQNLPNFICTQTTRRVSTGLSDTTADSTGISAGRAGMNIPALQRGPTPSRDVIEEELTFFDQKESYRVVAINGKGATGVDHLQVQGAITAGEFGSTLRDIFDPQSFTVFQWERSVRVHGRPGYVLAFRVPKENGTIVLLKAPDRRLEVSSSGQVVVDSETLAVLRITSRLDLPVGVPLRFAETTVEYGPVSIDGKTYNLPSRSEVRLHDSSRRYVNTIEFTHYHKFTSDSTIHYTPGSAMD